MITKTTGYQSSDGSIHGSLPEAQRAELLSLLAKYNEVSTSIPEAQKLANMMLTEQEAIIDILTMKASSKPRARKINGGTKTRAKKSTRHEAEQFALPMEDTTQPAA